MPLTEFALEAIQAVSLIFIGLSIFMLIALYRKNEARTRLEKAQQFILRWNDPNFIQFSSRVFEPSTINEMKRIVASREKIDGEAYRIEFIHVISILNFFEEMSLSVEFNLADERLLRRYFAQSAFEVFKSLEPIIVRLREERSNKSIFVTFERLVGRWSFEAAEDI